MAHNGAEMNRDELLKKAKASFKLASETEAKQREREIEDLRFQIPEFQWDQDARTQRRGGVIGGQVVPARPMLSISLLQQPLQLIQNQAANAHLGVDIHPVSEDAEEELAEVKQGLYRRIERDSNADQARLWALDRAKQCGRGWYRVNTQWDEDGDDPFDQEIVIERILRQDMVYIDPAASKEDFSDARWGIIAAWVPLETFREEFPDATAPMNDSDFRGWLTQDPEWVMGDRDDNKAVLVVEYFYKVYDRKEQKGPNGQKRTMESVRVKWAKLTGREVLEEQDWNGRHIPLIPVLGRELQPFDGERRWEGVVRQARDGQKLFNYAASNLVERMALEPKAPFIGAEGQFEGHEAEWEQANTRNFPFLEYKPTSIDGTPNPPPQRAQVDSSGMSLALMALQQGKQFVQSATSVYEPSLGQTPPGKENQSGRAIMALQQQSDAGTGHFIQALAQVSMAYEARVVLDLMPAIYDRPGRVTQILGAEDDARMVMLGQPYTEAEDGRPQAVPAPVPGAPPMPPPANVKEYDLSKGKYAISVNVGKSYQTRLQEGQSEIGEVLQAQPNLMPMLGATYFRFRNFPGAKEIADILKKIRDQQYPMLADKGEEQSPEQVQQQLQQAQQQIDEMQQQLQQATQALQTEQAKQQAHVQKAQIDAQSAMQVSQIKQETEIAIAKIKAQYEMLQAELKQSHAERTQSIDHAHEAGMAAAAPPAPDVTFRGNSDLPLDQG